MIDPQSAFFRLSDEMMSALEPDGRIVAANRAFTNTLGVVGPVEGRNIFEFVSPRYASILKTRLEENLPHDAVTFVMEFLASNGEPRVLKSTLHFARSSKRFAFICSSTNSFNDDASDDIRWRMALESTDAGFWSIDLTTNVAYFSERLETMLGFEPGELALSPETLRGLIHPDDYPIREVEVHPFLRGERSNFRYECRVRNKSGRYTWISSMGTRYVDSLGHEIAVGWHFDIQRYKEVEERLRQSEERSQMLLNTIPDLLFVFDREGKYIEAHTPTAAASVAPGSERIGRYVRDYFPAEFDSYWRGCIARALDGKKPVTVTHDLDIRGRKTYFEARVFPLSDDTVLAIMRDMTELRLSEERSALLLSLIPDLLFVLDREGRYIEARAADADQAVAPVQDLIGRYISEFFPPEFADAWKGYIKRTLDEKKMVVTEYEADVLKGHAHFEARMIPHTDDTVLAIVRDITERRVAQAELRKVEALMNSSSRLTALGEMAGGIAHEINNPLTVAHAHAARLHDLAEAGRKLDPLAVMQSAKKIEEVCMRISHIIAGLRSIARDGESDRFVLSPLKPIIEDALALSTEKFRHKQIELIVDPIPETIAIECRSVQISQVIVNLLLNAQHAVEDLDGGPRWIRVRTSEKKNTVQICVSDSGPGVMPAVRERIFDPFFTTKEVGQGTGLGLSVSASIAETHGGSITLDESQPNTTFVVTLQKRHRTSADADA